MQYAVIQTGGKQYRVSTGSLVTVEKLKADVGAGVILDNVLFLRNGDETIVGLPKVEKASVGAEVVEQSRGEKLLVFKKKRRKGYKKRQGHRQSLTTLKILNIGIA